MPYRGTWAAGEKVAFWRTKRGKDKQGKVRPPGFVRGIVIGPVGKDTVWIHASGRPSLVSREQVRDLVGTELWSPDAADIAELKVLAKKLAEGDVKDYDDVTKEQVPEGMGAEDEYVVDLPEGEQEEGQEQREPHEIPAGEQHDREQEVLDMMEAMGARRSEIEDRQQGEAPHQEERLEVQQDQLGDEMPAMIDSSEATAEATVEQQPSSSSTSRPFAHARVHEERLPEGLFRFGQEPPEPQGAAG